MGNYFLNLYDAFRECWRSGKDYVHCENSGDYLVKTEGDTLKIFFEKSDDFMDWWNNFSFIAIPWKPYKDMKHLWFCHWGFLKVWKSIKPYLVEAINNPDIKRIQVVGYSHGAALALLCYEYCTFNRKDIDIQGVGFGCPRVFWGIVPKDLKERLKNFKVVRNGKDIVTHVPPALFGFRHVSEIVKVGQGKSKGLFKDHYPKEYSENLKGVDE